MTRETFINTCKIDMYKTIKELYQHINYDWCAIWVYYKYLENICDFRDYIQCKNVASCTSLLNAMIKDTKDFINVYTIKNNIINVNLYTIGDIIFFDWDLSGDSDHVGIITNIIDGKIYYISGNTSNDNYLKSIVDIKTISIYDKRIRAIGHINNSFFNTIDEKNNIDISNLHEISENINTYYKDNLILSIMLRLNMFNVNISSHLTKQMFDYVEYFQKFHNLSVDRIVGVQTWSKLFEILNNDDFIKYIYKEL